jgi:putative transcriptional regulator
MNNLKHYRLKKGISQEELAIEIGVTQRHIAFIESGNRTPSLKIALKIANFFDIKIEDIFLPMKCTKSTQ